MYQPYYITETGTVGPEAGGALRSALLTAGASAATLTIRQNGADGQIVATIKAPIGTSVAVQWHGLVFSGQLHATLDGAGAAATLEM